MWRRLVATMAVGGLVVGAMLVLARPAMSAAGFSSQGPLLIDSDVGRALFDGGPLAPGDRRVACQTVTNAGSTTADVRLYGTTSGKGLGRFLRLTLVRGVLSGDHAPGSCRGFHQQAVLFDGSLDGFPDGYDDAIVEGGSWAPGEARAYRISVELRNDPDAQGLSAAQSFVWEVRAA